VKCCLALSIDQLGAGIFLTYAIMRLILNCACLGLSVVGLRLKWRGALHPGAITSINIVAWKVRDTHRNYGLLIEAAL
jgi:hypothetical protein